MVLFFVNFVCMGFFDILFGVGVIFLTRRKDLESNRTIYMGLLPWSPAPLHLCQTKSCWCSSLTTSFKRALSLAFGQKGVFVTVSDFSEEKGKEVASLVEKENSRFHSNGRDFH
ncbi:hypothetical protein Dsin_024771 [Dipteronia sinensis]|uniref:Uncharacterized protein n=1 Tax=Dipteronia sinensis TaxID=43782 RepID=A0AAD9ZV55_9ROSI|nr:hypothetical protein Dsin_024771 [Dipteronia sinensis]